MAVAKPKFGGNGRPQGDARNDRMGTVRKSPDGRMLAICWPSPPSPAVWWVTDATGSVGYEKPSRVSHWPVVGAVPCSPAAGMELAALEKTERTAS
jgi:hypothetical protein